MPGPGALWRIWVHVQVHFPDARMGLGMACSGVPLTLMHFDTVHFGHLEAAPFAALRETRVRFATELVGEEHFFVLGMPENMRTDFSPPVPIGEHEFAAREDGVKTELIILAIHGLLYLWGKGNVLPEPPMHFRESRTVKRVRQAPHAGQLAMLT